MPFGDRIDHGMERPALVASGDGARVPGGEDDAGVLGDLPHGGAEANGDVVVDGDGGDVGDRHGGAELLGTDVGEADVADEAVLAQPRERVDDLLEWSVGHGWRVQVVEVDVVQAEPARAHVRRVAEVVRVADGAHVGVLGAAADEPALGGDDQLFWVRVQGLADELLVGVRAVGVGRVDEGHARGDNLSQQRDALVMVGVFAPDLRSGQLHRPVTDAPNGQVAADRHGFVDVRYLGHYAAASWKSARLA